MAEDRAEPIACQHISVKKRHERCFGGSPPNIPGGGRALIGLETLQFDPGMRSCDLGDADGIVSGRAVVDDDDRHFRVGIGYCRQGFVKPIDIAEDRDDNGYLAPFRISGCDYWMNEPAFNKLRNELLVGGGCRNEVAGDKCVDELAADAGEPHETER